MSFDEILDLTADWRFYSIIIVFAKMRFYKGKRQKAVYRLVTAPQGGTQKYTLTFAYDSPRWLVK